MYRSFGSLAGLALWSAISVTGCAHVGQFPTPEGNPGEILAEKPDIPIGTTYRYEFSDVAGPTGCLYREVAEKTQNGWYVVLDARAPCSHPPAPSARRRWSLPDNLGWHRRLPDGSRTNFEWLRFPLKIGDEYKARMVFADGGGIDTTCHVDGRIKWGTYSNVGLVTCTGVTDTGPSQTCGIVVKVVYLPAAMAVAQADFDLPCKRESFAGWRLVEFKFPNPTAGDGNANATQ